MEGLGYGLEDQYEGQNDHGHGCDPSNDVEKQRIRVLSHEVLAVDEQQNKDDHDGKPDAIANLGKDKDFPKWCVGKENNTGADDDEHAVKPVEGWGLLELMIKASFETEAFADDMSGRQRKDGGGKERGGKEAEGERQARPFPC